ncbi:MAG: hypothetical protein GY861_25195 [bacterium]|nr:hypothetical protein [bacterium]
MKRPFFGGFLLGLLCSFLVCTVFGDWNFISSQDRSRVLGTSLLITNLGYSAWTPISAEITFPRATTGTVTFATIKGGVTNDLGAYTYTNGTSLFFTRAEFDGATVARNEIFQLRNSTGASSSNVVVNFESSTP